MDEVIYEGRAYVINVGRFNWLAGPDFDEWDAQERERTVAWTFPPLVLILLLVVMFAHVSTHKDDPARVQSSVICPEQQPTPSSFVKIIF